ncbi:MAG: hypothetical protein C0420_01675, partial [Methylobacterium sp.]|nr:hypothetical protein [Methylobacterium sp.]
RISGTAPAKAGTAASKPEPKAIAAAETAETTIDALVDHIVEGIDYGTASVPRIGELGQDWERAWLANRNGTTGPSASTRIGLIILLALAVAGAFRMASASWFRRRMQPASETFTARLVASSWGLLQDGATILLALMLARLCRNLWLPEADLASIALTTLANGAAIGAVYAAVGRFLLAPGADQRRLMPMPRAERHFKLLLVYAVVTPVIIVVLLLAGRVGSGPHPLAGLLLLSGLVALLFKLWWFHDMRRDLAALILGGSDSPGPWRRLIALAAPWFYMATAVVLWAVGRAAAMMSDGGRWAEAAAITQTAIVIIPIIAVGIGSFVDCRAARRAVTTGATPLSKAAGAAFRAAAVGVLWAAGFYVVARLWAGLLVGMSTAQFGTVSRQAAGVAVFAFAGWVALVFLRVFFDACAPKRRASGPMEEEEEGHADSVPSRLATVLPVLRGVVLGAVLGLTILIVLS